MDKWTSLPIICTGGLIQNMDALTQGTQFPGSATILQNYEPSISGGYRRITGFTKWDSAYVPDGNSNATSNPVLGVGVGLGGVISARKQNGTNDVDVFYSSGSGWGAVLNSSDPRSGSATKYRFIRYSISEETMLMTDGVDRAATYNGSAYAEIDGTGAPAAPAYAVQFRNRVMLAPGSNASSIVISAPGTDTDFNGVNGAIEINVGDTVVGLGRFRETPYIFCENSIYKLSGTTKADFAIVSVTESIGCVSGDSIQELGGDLIFLAPDGLRSIAATEKIGDVNLGILSDPINPTIDSYIGSYAANDFSSCPIRKKSQYRLFPYKAGVADGDSPGVLGKLNMNHPMEWATTSGMNAYCANSGYDGDNEVAVFGHPTDGFVYRMESGSDFAGANINYTYRSPDITFQDATIRKVLQKITLYTELEGDIDINLNVLFDFQDTAKTQPAAINIAQSSSGAKYGTALYGTDTYGSTDVPVFKKNLIGSGFTAAFQFNNTNANPPHRIDSFQVQLAPQGRR